MADGIRVPDKGALSTADKFLGVDSTGTTGLLPLAVLPNLLGINRNVRVTRPSVTDLEADTAISQVGGAADYVSDGDIVQAGRHFYEVDSAAAANTYIENSAGAPVRLKPFPTPWGHNPEAWGAKFDGTTDDAPVFQKMVDAGILDIMIDAPGGATIGMSYPVLIHGSAGFRLRGVSSKVKFVPLSDMAFDSSRLSGLGLSLANEYDGRQCFFMITAYDGENDRTDKAARDYLFENIGVNAEGTAWVRQISFVSAPHSSHIIFKDCVMETAAHLLDPWLLSDMQSRHYHNAYQNIRMIKSLNLTSGEYVDGNAFVPRVGDKAGTMPSYGSSMNIDEVSHEACRQGLKVYGQGYSDIGPFSVDNNFPGTYAVDVFDSQVHFGSIGIENRLGRITDGSDTSGGGALRIHLSQVNIGEITMLGGDSDGNATEGYPISDYDDGSGEVTEGLIVIDESTVNIGQLYVNHPKGDGTQWPIVVKNGAIVRVQNAAFSSIDTAAEWDVQDTSRVILLNDDGTETAIMGPGAKTYHEMSNICATGGDDTTGVANNTLDVKFNTGVNVPTLINQGEASSPEPAVYHLPHSVYGGRLFGFIERIGAGDSTNYMLRYLQDDGRAFIRYRGGSWGPWHQIGGPLPEVTAANIADVTADVNTLAEKVKGATVWDSTNSRAMRATGDADSDAWEVIDGSASVTPS